MEVAMRGLTELQRCLIMLPLPEPRTRVVSHGTSYTTLGAYPEWHSPGCPVDHATVYEWSACEHPEAHALLDDPAAALAPEDAACRALCAAQGFKPINVMAPPAMLAGHPPGSRPVVGSYPLGVLLKAFG